MLFQPELCAFLCIQCRTCRQSQLLNECKNITKALKNGNKEKHFLRFHLTNMPAEVMHPSIVKCLKSNADENYLKDQSSISDLNGFQFWVLLHLPFTSSFWDLSTIEKLVEKSFPIITRLSVHADFFEKFITASRRSPITFRPQNAVQICTLWMILCLEGLTSFWE